MNELLERCKILTMKWVSNLSTAQKVGYSILTIIILIGFLTPYLPIADPSKTGVPYLRPSLEHILGTNDLGQDNLSKLIHATGNTLLVALVATVMSLFVGVAVGVLAGYRRGNIGEALMGLTDVFLLMPAIPLMIVIASYLDPSIWNVVLVIVILWWCSTARVMYARTLQLRDTGYVKAARSQGKPTIVILLKYIIPNAWDILVARFTLSVVASMLAEASLAFLGLGDPLSLTWGMLLNNAFARGGFFNNFWWWYLPPGIMIAITAMGFLLIGSKKNKDKVRSDV